MSPDVFKQGMTVTHPEYGPGKIVALSGSGKNRRATIQFATVGEKKIILRTARCGRFRGNVLSCDCESYSCEPPGLSRRASWISRQCCWHYFGGDKPRRSLGAYAVFAERWRSAAMERQQRRCFGECCCGFA